MKLRLPKTGIPMPDYFLLLSFLFPFSVYLMTLAPSVTFFDSGEFMTAAASLGSAHSPGYPLFLMYVKPFTLLPIGNIAFRVNIATAFSAAAACMMVYLLVVTLLKGETLTEDSRFNVLTVKLAALAAALIFAFSERLWLQSNHDKPYPLLACITASIFFLLLKWSMNKDEEETSPAPIYLAAFLAALAMAVHQTVVLLLPAWILMIIATDWKILARLKEMVITFAFACMGLAVHLYLPLRASTRPLLNWGNPVNLDQFLWHFLRKGYPVEVPDRSLSLLWTQLGAFDLTREFSHPGLILIVLGGYYLYRTNKTFLGAYALSVLVFLGVISGYLNTPAENVFLTEEFFTPLYQLSAILIGLGLFYLLGYLLVNWRLARLTGTRLYCAVILLFFSLPAALCAFNYLENDQHENYIAYDYAANTLHSLPEMGVLFTWGDSGAFPLWYLQGVERLREDIDLPHTPHLVFDWYIDSMPRLFTDSLLYSFDKNRLDQETALKVAITELLETRPVFIDFSTRYSTDFIDFKPVQRGIVYSVIRSGDHAGVPDLSIWDNFRVRGIIDKQNFFDLDTGKAILIYANSYLEVGESLAILNRRNEALSMLARGEFIAEEMRGPADQIRRKYALEKR